MSIIDSIGESSRKLFTGKSVSAVILSAGEGTRMNSSVMKNLLKIGDKPIISYSLTAFEKSPYNNEIVLVVRDEDIDLYKDIVKNYSITKIKAVVAGGKTRQESSWIGFNKCSDNPFVAFHDGARPFVNETTIKNVVLAAYEYKSATAAVRTINTIKESNISNVVVKTLDRSNLWEIHTPQVFYSNLYRASYYFASNKGFKATDDCSIVEYAGFNTYLVEDSRSNLKITEPFDLELANTILKSGEYFNNGL